MKKDITIPEGCKKVHIEIQEGLISVSYFSKINDRQFLCKETGEMEVRPGMGDFSIFWDKDRRDRACCANFCGMDGEKYRCSDDVSYDEAVRFRNYNQFLLIRGVYED